MRGSDEYARAFGEMVTSSVGALIVQPSLPRQPTTEAALKSHLPLFAPSDEFTRVGGLMSYSADILSVYRKAAIFVDKIIKGSKPADLPVEFPTKFQLIVNLKTAKALGLMLPPTLQGRRVYLHATCKIRSTFGFRREFIGEAQLRRSVDDRRDETGLTHLDQLNVGQNNVGFWRLGLWHE